MFQTALDQIENGVQTLQRTTDIYRDLQERLNSTVRALEGMGSFFDITAILRRKQGELELQENSLEQLEGTLMRIAQYYQDCESKIVDYLENRNRDVQNSGFGLVRTADSGEWGRLIQFWEE